MVCPYCSSETQVTNSRHQKRVNNVWRRRLCRSCGLVFTTHEKADLTTSTVVRKDPKTLEPLDRDKLFISVYESCRHRPTALQDASALTETILGKILQRQSTEGVIELQTLIDTVITVLRQFDTVSATYYHAYFSDKR